jgi:hypothetical protein
MLCPNCQTPLHEVFFGDEIRRWRCMGCFRIFSEIEYEVKEDELVKRWQPYRKK